MGKKLDLFFNKTEHFVDAVLAWLYKQITNPLFTILLAFILAALVETKVTNIIVACVMFGAWSIAFIWISRSESIKKLSVKLRLICLLAIAIFLAWPFYEFAYWALTQYSQHRTITQESKQPESKEEPVAENEHLKQPIANSNVVPEVQVKLIFKDSPLFTPQRKQQITLEIDGFRKYLVSLGFGVPKETPPIGTHHGKGFTATYSSPAVNPTFNAEISIGDEAINDPTSWRNAYAQYFFRVIFDGDRSIDNPELKFRWEWTVMIFADYFTSSYSNERPQRNIKSFNGWVNALWDIRNSCGRDFTDRALFYTFEFKIIKNNFKYFKENFNEDFSYRFSRGAWTVDNDHQNMPKIGAILKRYNLL